MSAQDIEDEFPKLRAEGYTITSPDVTDYNCFAFAMHDKSDWWSPLPTSGYYWPADKFPRNAKVETLIAIYAYEGGFELCDNGEFEAGFEKVAIYQDVNGRITHAARQTASGMWTSKLGSKEDIEHPTLASIEDDGIGPNDYGKVVKFMKRPMPPPPPPAIYI